MGKVIRRTSLMCALPEDVLSSGARVTMMGRGTVLVEGQRGVVELDISCIRLRTAQGVLGIRGRNLHLQELSVDAAIIHGEELESVSYKE